MIEDPMKQVGQAVANVAATYDKSNISSRNMLLSPEFWTDVAKTMQSPTVNNMPDATVVKPGVIILIPTSVATGIENQKLTIMGSWFTMESKIVFDGVELETQMHGPDRLTATIPVASDPTSVSIFVRTGTHETAPPQTFTYTEAKDVEDDDQIDAAGAEGRSAEDGPGWIGDRSIPSGDAPIPVPERGDEPDA